MRTEFIPARIEYGSGDYSVDTATGSRKRRTLVIHRHFFASKAKALEAARKETEKNPKNGFVTVERRGIEIAAFLRGVRHDKDAPPYHEGEWISPKSGDRRRRGR